MGMTLVNGFLAFKFITDQELTLWEFTNGVALAMCAKVVEGGGGAVVAATRSVLQASAAALETRLDPGDMQHTLFNRLALSLSGTCREGQCWLCSHPPSLSPLPSFLLSSPL